MMKREIFTAVASRLRGAHIVGQLRRTMQLATRASQIAAFVSGPLTRAACAIFALMVAAVLLAATLSSCWASVGLSSAFRVGCWFS
jgi:hypothetical protein